MERKTRNRRRLPSVVLILAVGTERQGQMQPAPLPQHPLSTPPSGLGPPAPATPLPNRQACLRTGVGGGGPSRDVAKGTPDRGIPRDTPAP